ncbi:MAG: hypothetical protein M3065_00730 [Actinomycetota bacterium]|nr:hypothetical protein [Actinomycetota bacterium]
MRIADRHALREVALLDPLDRGTAHAVVGRQVQDPVGVEEVLAGLAVSG